jgi:2-polyprenyl-3-methyl-5-hydroxy-6-metoxy-1,4-benzoquinol methylase
MSMERIYPDSMEANGEITGDETLRLHLERYRYAGRHLVPGSVADIACGSGYGSHLLATEYSKYIRQIIAGDIDQDTISFARTRYAHPLIEFIVTDALGFEANTELDNVLSLETIEHLENPVAFVQQVARQLAKGGRFMASAPITPSMDANPYHLHDFTATSFRKMFTDAGLHEIDSFIQVQPYQPLPLLQRKEERSKDLRRNILRYYLTHPGKFFLRISSMLKDGFTNKYLVVVFEKL